MEKKLTNKQQEAMDRLRAGAVLTFRMSASPRMTTWYVDDDPISYRVGKALVAAGLIRFSGRKENGGTLEHWEVVR